MFEKIFFSEFLVFPFHCSCFCYLDSNYILSCPPLPYIQNFVPKLFVIFYFILIAILSLAFRSLSPATTMDAPLWAPDYFMSVFRLVIFILLFFFFFFPLRSARSRFNSIFFPSFLSAILFLLCDVLWIFFFFSHLKNIFLMAQSPYFTLAHGDIFRREFLRGVL